MLDAWIYDGVRTPFGRHGGALAGLRPDDMLAAVLAALIGRNPFPADSYEDVIAGCVCQSGEDSRNVARFAGLLAGLPETVPAQTVNRLCGSGLAAVIDAARAITVGEAELILAGGVESMSRAPYVLSKAERPYDRGAMLFDATIGTRFPNPAFVARFGDDAMPQTADAVARECGISREAADAYAVASQARWEAARAAGAFDGEILALDVPQGGKADPLRIDADEHPRPGTRLDRISALKPIYAGGVTTAANASGINDGAAAMILGSRSAGEAAGAAPLARVLAGAVTGVAPRVMGLGPATAIPKALGRAGLALSDIDLIEINEAFAAQVLGVLKRLGLDAGDPRVNPAGGAIAVGHPLGASGARLALTAARRLRETGGRHAVVSLCVGLGQGIALVIEAA